MDTYQPIHQTAYRNNRIASRSPIQLTSFQLTNFQPWQKQKKPTAAQQSQTLLEILDKDKRDPIIVWDDLLARGSYDSQVVAIVTTWLHRQKRFSEAVSGLEAAIRNGLAEPWMYDVLAIEMKLAKRPQKQIDRVLVSRIDFAAGNDTQLLVAASNLAGFDAYDEALGLCRELAKRNPHQPELWSTARRVADLTGKFDVRIWARVQTLRNVWEPGFETLHKQMQAELRDLLKEAVKGRDQKAVSDIRESLADAMRQDLRVRIEWIGDGDLDLSVEEPGGLVCSRHQKVTANGGLLVKQDIAVSSSSKRQVEEYVCVDAVAGNYRVRVNHIDGRVLLGRVQVKVIKHAGTAAEVVETKSLTGVVEAAQEFGFTYDD